MRHLAPVSQALTLDTNQLGALATATRCAVRIFSQAAGGAPRLGFRCAGGKISACGSNRP